jgi:hypothetical protein
MYYQLYTFIVKCGTGTILQTSQKTGEKSQIQGRPFMTTAMTPPSIHLKQLQDFTPWVLYGGCGVAILIIHRVFFSSPQYPASIPRIGEPPGRTWFSPRTTWRYYTDCASLYKEAYDKVHMCHYVEMAKDPSYLRGSRNPGLI